jgi:hypothetical protein
MKKLGWIAAIAWWLYFLTAIFVCVHFGFKWDRSLSPSSICVFVPDAPSQSSWSDRTHLVKGPQSMRRCPLLK